MKSNTKHIEPNYQKSNKVDPHYNYPNISPEI